MADDVMLRQAIDAIRRGQRRRARDLLTRLLRADQTNPTYWLWMSSVVDTPKEREHCLREVLRLDPGNKAAERGLVLIGAMPPPEDLKPLPPVRRKWAPASPDVSPLTGSWITFSNPLWRIMIFSTVGILIIILMLIGFFGFRTRPGASSSRVKLTITPITWTPRPTATLLPTNTPWFHTPTPTFAGPTPLWMLLEITHTPTPLYVETPHPVSEAYRAGLRALRSRDFKAMLEYMKQAAQLEPDAPDTHYYVGEAHLLLDQPEDALQAYHLAILTNPNFAPAYLGRAQAALAIDPNADIKGDLDLAIAKDPNLANAYLERVAYFIRQRDAEAAFEDLKTVEELLPHSPLIPLYRAQAYMLLGDKLTAMELALQTYDLDRSLLPAYLTLGQAYLLNGKPEQALELLRVYLLFENEDYIAWVTQGQALNEIGQYEQALEALNRAIELNDEAIEGYLNRGYVYLALGEGQSAVNDFFTAYKMDNNSFEASLGLGRALFVAKRFKESYDQISSSRHLASSDAQLAEVYYWRAQVLEAQRRFSTAIKDWQALLALPAESVPSDWAATAWERVLALTPSPPATRPPTPVPSTPTPSAAGASTFQIDGLG